MAVVGICLVTPSAPTAVMATDVALVVCQFRVTESPLVMLLLEALNTRVGAVGGGWVTVTWTCCGLLSPPGPVAVAE